ncbi:hypothetical protein ES705_22893 [subsurface metagenome]
MDTLTDVLIAFCVLEPVAGRIPIAPPVILEPLPISIKSLTSGVSTPTLELPCNIALVPSTSFLVRTVLVLIEVTPSSICNILN